jgi:hypothetical protein
LLARHRTGQVVIGEYQVNRHSRLQIIPRLIGRRGFDDANTQVAESLGDRKSNQRLVLHDKYAGWQRFRVLPHFWHF